MSGNQAARGSALLIMLGAIVLVLLLLLAFFSQSTIQQQVSKSSSAQATEDVFIQGAVSTIIGDLQQEIAAGATVTTNVTGSTTNIIYLPATNTVAVPAISGFTTNAGLENLLKVSMGGSNFFPTSYPNAGVYSPANRASTVATTTASLNGRSIAALRWNGPLLIARQNPTSTTDFTPTNTFNAPQWIYVARNGGNPTNWNTKMVSSQTNGTTVIGRYAYVIYHEGGLLDANVAGCPTNLTSTLFPPLANRPGTYMADLSQIGLTTNQIGALVGWRNTNSASAIGSYPNYTITANGAISYASNAMTATNGFLATFTNSSGSDRQFTSRQQLMTFLQNADPTGVTNALNSLRYLGTFSRDLNQPSLYWPTNIPTIVSGIGTLAANYTDYGGGNSDYTDDFQINTNFLTTRVSVSFTRNDGSTAMVGEPLIKKRFPLEYLAWITCKGPSAGRILADADMASLLTNPGVTPALLTNGTSANIQKYFGLVWNSTDNLWDYAPAGSPATPAVSPLKLISGLTGTREPNFIELLKASIKVGSLGKSVGGFSSSSDKVVYGTIHCDEATTDNHVVQLAANIIEQAKSDAYPVKIRFAPTNSQILIFAGSENLPYLLRWRNIAVDVSQPYIGSTPITNPVFYTTNASSTNYTYPITNGNTLYPGYGVFLIVPEIWNPYDLNSSSGVIGPSSIRIVADNLVTNTMPSTDGSVALGGPANVSVSQAVGTSGGSYSPAFPLPAFQLSPSSSAIYNQSYSTYQNLFREPMCLRTPGIGGWTYQSPTTLMNGSFPADRKGSTTTLVTSNGVTDWRDGSSNNIMGIMMGYFPLTATISYNGTNYAIDGNSVGVHWAGPRHNQDHLTFRMQYLDANSVWRDYDVKKWVNTSWNSSYPSYLRGTGNGTFSTNMTWDDMIGSGGSAYVFDPRTMRFGINSAQYGQGEAPFYKFPNGICITNTYITTATQSNNVQIGLMVTNLAKSNNILGTSHYDLYGFQSTNKLLNNSYMNGFISAAGAGFTTVLNASTVSYSSIMDAGFCINSSNRVQVYPTNGGWNSSAWYTDPDGVQRMAMGAYASPGYTNAGATSTNLGIPTITATANWNTNNAAPTYQSQSRPTMLHRPFRSVAELGYVFRDIPWKNIDFFTPESGDAGLLDAFCIHDSSITNALAAGKVNLNTRQAPVLLALLSGSQTDQLLMSGTNSYTITNPAVLISPVEMTNIANRLVSRTATSSLSQIGDLVGQYQGGGVYSGFSADLTNCYTNPANIYIQRFHESAIRSLANSGQTRVWNILIDVIAQPGFFPGSATVLSSFQVQGERRWWVHLAIDRITDKVIDCQIEPVSE